MKSYSRVFALRNQLYCQDPLEEKLPLKVMYKPSQLQDSLIAKNYHSLSCHQFDCID